MVTRRNPPARAAAAPARGNARAPARTASAPAGRGFIRGSAGRTKTDAELRKAEERRDRARSGKRMPFRFWMPPGTSGRQIIVVDNEPDFFMYEHQYQDATGERMHVGCVKEFDNCPACESLKKEGTYCMYLTVIDLEAYTNKQGDEVPFSKKLYVVKPGQQKKFLRHFERQGTMRGALFDLARDGDQDPVTGNDVEFVEFVPEEELETYISVWTDREGTQHEENCFEPYAYEEIFEEPNTDSLRAIFGGSPSPGSRRANTEALQTEEAYVDDGTGAPWEGDEEEVVEETPPARGARTATRAAAPARTATRAAAPAPRRGRAAEPVAEEDEVVEDEVETAPPPRRSAVRTAAAPARTAPAPRQPVRSAGRSIVRRGR